MQGDTAVMWDLGSGDALCRGSFLTEGSMKADIAVSRTDKLWGRSNSSPLMFTVSSVDSRMSKHRNDRV